MAVLLLIVLMQFAWSFASGQQGGGSYAYSDSTGKRLSGTYGLKDGKVVQSSGDFPAAFSDAALPGLRAGGPIRRLNPIRRFPQPQFPDFGRFGGGYNNYNPFPNFEMPHFPNSAYASGAIGPGYRQQIASINPANPNMPNVNINKINHYSDTPGRGGYYSVSSNSYASSSNINGQEVSRRGAETVVDDNGKITKYKVQN